MSLSKRSAAEFIGTFWLVLGGCGSAVLAAGIPDVGIGYVGVAFAFGLTVLTMAYAIGHISGCHLNPAVTLGLTVAGRFKGADAPAYMVPRFWVLSLLRLFWCKSQAAQKGMQAASPRTASVNIHHRVTQWVPASSQKS